MRWSRPQRRRLGWPVCWCSLRTTKGERSMRSSSTPGADEAFRSCLEFAIISLDSTPPDLELQRLIAIAAAARVRAIQQMSASAASRSTLTEQVSSLLLALDDVPESERSRVWRDTRAELQRVHAVAAQSESSIPASGALILKGQTAKGCDNS